ncbi:unnamed protein product, partial [Laminaria digitata]
MGAVRLGVDIGGTFTDLVLLEEETGRSLVVKVPSRPDLPAEALLSAVTKAIEQAGIQPDQVNLLNHGTTI